MEANQRVSAATPTEDDEAEHSYRGFFTVHRSADFMLKICFTLVVFVLIVILTSLHITRKNYRLPNLFRASRLRRAFELFKIDALVPQPPPLQKNECLAIGCPSGWLIMHRLSFRDIKLPIQTFSCAPVWLREESYGLLFSCASAERRILAHLVDYAFHDLPYIRIEAVVKEEMESLLSENLNVIDDYCFDSVARRAAMQLVLNLVDDEDTNDRATMRVLQGILDDLKSVHYGTRKLSIWDRFSAIFGVHNSAREALAEVKRILELPIRVEMDNVSENAYCAKPNFLQTFIAARLELEEEGDQTSFLTVAHLAHAAIDSLVLLEEILIPAYRWSLLILGHRPDLAEKLSNELENRGRVGPVARAFALELVRWTQVGCQLSSVQLLDDWSIPQTDFPVRSVLMYDMKSTANDPQIWGDPECFRPERFKLHHDRGLGWSAKVTGSESAVEDLLEASGWGNFVPIEFLLHMISAGAANLASTFKLRVQGNEDLKMAPHSLSRLPVPFSFHLSER